MVNNRKSFTPKWVHENQAGQSTIEFALTMIMLIAFILFYFQLSMIFAYGSYAHYASFMAARAYLSSGPDSQDQTARAKSVMSRMVKRGEGQSGADRMPWLAKGVGQGDPVGVTIGQGSAYQDGNTDFSWMQGVQYQFNSKIFIMPFGGSSKSTIKATGGSNSPPNTVTLTAESWLGREPTTYECLDALSKTGWIFDNGC